MCYRYTKSFLTELFNHAFDMFIDCIETDIGRSNIILEFFTHENGLEVYERFCKEYFPKHLSEDYKKIGYFDSFAAQAFVGDNVYGVLIREDVDFLDEEEWFRIFLHEISHLFCTKNEIDGKNFFDTYCMGSDLEDGAMNAGYAIWRETIADIMADSIICDYSVYSLKQEEVLENITSLYNYISANNPDSKKAMSLLIFCVMSSKEVACTENWHHAETAIKDINICDELMISILKLVFNQLLERPFWKITPDFIVNLGALYLMLISHKLFKSRIDT